MPRLVAVDARGYFTGGGIGRYTRNLLRELAETAAGRFRLRVLISNRHQPRDLDTPVGPDDEVVVSQAEWMNRADEDRLLEREVEDCDLFHSLTGHWLPARVPAIATLHDLTPVMHPLMVTKEVREIGRQTAETIARATHIVASSHSTADDARQLLGLRLPPLSVVHLAAAPGFAPAAPSGNVLTRFGLIARGFVLAVSAFNPHKNLPRLVEAYARSGIAAPLVIVGAERAAADSVRDEIARLQLATRVRLVGRVTDEDLAGLYGTCRMFVYPSLYEGFGLPVIEAMACGAAVVSSNRSSIPEVAGDAALLVDVSRAERLAAAIARLDSDGELRADLRARAAARAGTFSWARTAAATADTYQLALSEAQAA